MATNKNENSSDFFNKILSSTRSSGQNYRGMTEEASGVQPGKGDFVDGIRKVMEDVAKVIKGDSVQQRSPTDNNNSDTRQEASTDNEEKADGQDAQIEMGQSAPAPAAVKDKKMDQTAQANAAQFTRYNPPPPDCGV